MYYLLSNLTDDSWRRSNTLTKMEKMVSNKRVFLYVEFCSTTGELNYSSLSLFFLCNAGVIRSANSKRIFTRDSYMYDKHVLGYNYTYLDRFRISPVNCTRRVLQKISLHHRSILSASTRKKHFEVPITHLPRSSALDGFT